MKKTFWSLLVVGAIAIGALGCGKIPDAAPNAAKPGTPEPVATSGHTHEGWWCDEHGVPEEVCGLCNAKLAAKFKADGDWCEKHDRPDSQCFVCHPEFEEQFAAQYEAKYGKKPPKPEL